MITYLKDKESRSIGILFLVNALIMANWLVRIPDIKRHLELSDSELGLALLGAPIGVILFTPITTIGINRLGVGKMALIMACGTALAVVFLGMPQHFYQLFLALLFFGITNGSFDISMNGLAAAIEKKQNRVLMSTTHGFWSLGAMFASFLGGFIAGQNVAYLHHFIGAALFGMIIIMMIWPVLWSIKDKTENELKLIWPGRQLLVLIFLCLMIFIVEGGIADWAALFFEKVLSSPKYFWGFGFGGFSAAMAIGRFGGDRLLSKYAARHLLIVCYIFATIGVVLFALGQSIWLCTLAMVITGLASAIIVPLIFREASHSKVVAPSLGLALVSSIGYAGFLLGPPVIGFVSEAFGLRMSFFFLAFILGLSLLLSLSLKK